MLGDGSERDVEKEAADIRRNYFQRAKTLTGGETT
jgi:hypothetical protein